jgi:hypothetical protein
MQPNALKSLTCVVGLLLTAVTVQAETYGVCKFDSATRQFQGKPVEQARCLLRHVAVWGKVSTSPAKLPPSLEALIGIPVDVSRAQLKAQLVKLGLESSAVGGDLDGPVAARYFVIHDTSTPWLGDASTFPPDGAPAVNSFEPYKKSSPVAHVFVNRTGQTFLGHDFSAQLAATKLEKHVIGTPALGVALHIELLQPRRRHPAGGPKNDALAPRPGFTPVQYKRLALLYVAASARAGTWLVPATHAAIDDGIKNGHDDPQNFTLADFAAAVEQLRLALAITAPAADAAPPSVFVWRKPAISEVV